MNNGVDICVVVPCYNEIESIPELYHRLTTTMSNLSSSYEFLFVNDGSCDRTLDFLKEIQTHDKHIRILDLARNFGHQAAVSAGLDHAMGKAVVVMDADLQDPPEVIPELVARWQEGYDVVYGIRTKRKEGLPKRLAYAVFYRLLKAASGMEMPLDAGDFALLDGTVVTALRSLPERNRYLRGLRSWVGFSQLGVRYERSSRQKGKSKYSIKLLLELASSGFVSFSRFPLRIAVYAGVVISTIAFFAGLITIGVYLSSSVEPQGWTSLMVVILFLGGIQLLTVGIIGEYVGHILDEVKQRPIYIVRQHIGY
jgi:polyisoprenyl-phosphate glycosyltransferase